MTSMPCAFTKTFTNNVNCYLLKGSNYSNPKVLVYDFGDINANG